MTPATSADASLPSKRGLQAFRWYLAGYGSYFIGLGLNMVLFQYLIVVHLGETPARFAFAQTLSIMPMLLFSMVGGSLADRFELRSHIVRLQLLSALPHIGLAVLIGFNQLVFPAVIATGVAFAAVSALILPARDSLLTSVALSTRKIPIPRAVGIATSIQFGAQLIGFTVAGMADKTGPLPPLLIISLTHLLAAFCTSRLSPEKKPNDVAQSTTPKQPFFMQFFGGFREVWRSDTFRPILISQFFMAVFGMGPTLVVVPLIVDQVYDGNAGGLAAINFFWIAGIMTTAIIQSVIKPIVHQGRTLIISMSGGIIAMFALHFAPPFWAALLAVYFWGLVGGTRMALSRAIIQEGAPSSHRGRILSVFAVAMSGGIPLGTALSGVLVSFFGPLNAILFGSAGFALVCVCMLFFTRMWYIKRQSSPI